MRRLTWLALLLSSGLAASPLRVTTITSSGGTSASWTGASRGTRYYIQCDVEARVATGSTSATVTSTSVKVPVNALYSLQMAATENAIAVIPSSGSSTTTCQVYLEQNTSVLGTAGLTSISSGSASSGGGIATGVTAAAGTSATISGTVANGASAVGVIVDNTPALSTAGALALSVRTGGSQVAKVDYAGVITSTGLNMAADGQQICMNGAASRCIRWVASTYDFSGTAPIVTGSVIAEVASGSNGLRLTNAGARVKLSVGGTLDYLDSDGTRARVGGGTGELSVGVLKLDRTDSSGTPGNVTLNKSTGKVAIALGANAVTVTNSVSTAAAGCIVTLNTIDATLTTAVCVPGAGSLVITGNANATAATTVTFWLTP